MKYITTVEDKQFLVEIIDDKHISVDGKLYGIDFETVSGQPVYSLIVDGKSHESYEIGRASCRERVYSSV